MVGGEGASQRQLSENNNLIVLGCFHCKARLLNESSPTLRYNRITFVCFSDKLSALVKRPTRAGQVTLYVKTIFCAPTSLYTELWLAPSTVSLCFVRVYPV